MIRVAALTIRESCIINPPGSPKGVKESLQAVREVLPHALELMQGGGH